MATINVYDIGDLVRITGDLATAAGVAIDPTALVCKVLSPAGTTTTYTYGTTAFPIRDGTGEYHVDVTPTEEGDWYYSFTSTGTGQAMDDGSFRVRAKAI